MALKSCHDRNITHRDVKPGKDVGQFVIESDVYVCQFRDEWRLIPADIYFGSIIF